MLALLKLVLWEKSGSDTQIFSPSKGARCGGVTKAGHLDYLAGTQLNHNGYQKELTGGILKNAK